MQPIDIRIQTVLHFLKRFNSHLDYHVIAIHDPYGPTITDKSLQALVGSKESFKGCESVNQQRKEIVFPLLKLVVIEVFSTDSKLINEDVNTKISSSRIREWIQNKNIK